VFSPPHRWRAAERTQLAAPSLGQGSRIRSADPPDVRVIAVPVPGLRGVVGALGGRSEADGLSNYPRRVSRSRRGWSLVAAACLALGCGEGALREARRSDPRLNVVVVTLDTTRADALGSYGQPLEVTPHIDAAAAEGLVFEQVRSSSPSTLPSHATLFTGQQPYAHGVRANSGYVLADENATLAEALRDAGWSTGAEVAAAVLARFQHLDQGFERYRDPLSEGAGSHAATRHAVDVTDRGLAFLRENRHRPFFLWLHYYDPHSPFTPPPRYRDALPGHPYLAEVRFVDDQVGRVLAAIEELGLRDQTLVVITADHGEGLGEHGEETHAFFVYDSTIRVPLVFWGAPLVPRGTRVATPVQLVDVAPTLLDLLGLPPLPEAQGVSLRLLFDDPTLDLALTAYGESIAPLALFGSDALRFVQQGRWKYVHKLEPELFDVEADPGELENLAARQPQRVAQLRARLEALLSGAPAAPHDAEARLAPETLAQLRALGYLSGRPRDRERSESLELRGPDPVSRTEDLRIANRAWSAFQAGRNAAAARDFQLVYDRNPESAAVLEGLLGALMRSAPERPDLLALARRGVELDPDSTNFRIMLALLLRQRGRSNESERVLRETLELDRCAVEARLQLADLLAQRGDTDGRDALLRGAEACPKSEAARRVLEQF
jgi:arylsulfatase A-like enzyme